MRRYGAILFGLIGLVQAGAVIPAGTELSVRLQTGINSGVAKPDQRFEAIAISDLRIGDAVAIPAGAVVRGFVGSVRASTKVDHKGTLTLSFDQIVLHGSPVPLRATIVQVIDGKMSPADSGASRLTGGQAPLIGVIVTDGGTIASTEASNVDLPIGTILRIRLDKALI